MSTKKYVPPHLRNSQASSPSRGSSSERYNDDRAGSRRGYSDRYDRGYQDRGYQDRGYQDRGYQDRGYQDRGYQDRGYDRGYSERRSEPRMNSRWSNFDSNTRSSRDNSYRGRGYVFGRNELGFHGDMTSNARLEADLFGDVKSSGINFDKYDDIPVETSGENVPEAILEFRVEELGERVCANLERCKYTRPTPVQKYSIPIGLDGRDMMACAQTGSGKTGGFLFPTLAMMLRRGGGDIPEDTSHRPKVYPTALVLAPTRELASQIYDEARKFCYCTGIAPVVVYGGAEVGRQLRELERGCDLLVATPGRLVDLIERGRISLKAIRFLVLDEADRMLDMGFEPQIRRIVEEEDMSRDRQTFLFSATFPKEIQRLAADFLRDYIFLTVGRVGSASKDVKQTLEYVEQHDKDDYLLRFLSQVHEGLILIFVETKRGADYLEDLLCHEGFPATSIHGDRSQREREAALRSFKSGRTPVLVATDVAARGLDINGVTQVINFDMPSNIDDYVHRIGRTGRVGHIGHAMSMVNEKNRNVAKDLYELVVENGQDCPPWLDKMCRSFGHRGGSNRRGGGRFGARDYRKDDRRSNRNSNYNNGGWRNNAHGGGTYDDNSAW